MSALVPTLVERKEGCLSGAERGVRWLASAAGILGNATRAASGRQGWRSDFSQSMWPLAGAKARSSICKTHNGDMFAEYSLASYSRTIPGDLDDLDRSCALVHQLSRHFHSLAGVE